MCQYICMYLCSCQFGVGVGTCVGTCVDVSVGVDTCVGICVDICVRIGVGRDSSISERFRKIEWPLQIRRENSRLAKMYKTVNNLSHAISPNTQYLIPTTSVTRRNHNFKFIQNSPVTDCFKYSFFPRTVTEWNTLANDIVSASSLDSFKRRLISIYSLYFFPRKLP